MVVTAIIVAAGRGKRLKGSIPKQFRELDGVPLISFSLYFFEKSRVVNEIIVVTLPDWIDHVKKKIVQEGKFGKVKNVVAGGEFRQDSFKRGLEKAGGDIVIDHDAVRPFPELLDVRDMVDKCEDCGAIIPVISVRDTVKYLDGDMVKNTIERDNLYYVQTPQVFKRNLCEMAYRKAEENGFQGSDTASLFENAQIPVYITAGSLFNIKITTYEDLSLARLIDQYYLKHG